MSGVHNNSGQLGLGNNDYCSSPQKLIFNEQIILINCGGYHTIALTQNGELYVWGANSFGELGLGDHNDKYTPWRRMTDKSIIDISCGMHHTILLTNDGKMKGWGANIHKQIGLEWCDSINIPYVLSKDKFVIAVKCGLYHTIFLTKTGDLYSGGDNLCGQLGLGHNANRDHPQKISLRTICVPIKSIHCGHYYTMILTDSGKIYVWGDNSNGQLGIGHNKSICSPQELIV